MGNATGDAERDGILRLIRLYVGDRFGNLLRALLVEAGVFGAPLAHAVMQPDRLAARWALTSWPVPSQQITMLFGIGRRRLPFLWRRCHARRRLRALQDPALNAPAIAGFAGVHPVLRVDGDHVGADEFAGLASGPAEAIENREVLAAQHPDPLIGTVDQIEQALI